MTHDAVVVAVRAFVVVTVVVGLAGGAVAVGLDLPSPVAVVEGVPSAP
ncbi:hypothetical protein [Cellulomonas carbonis]|nr:hypothetical protein [Cellulomonas carbonis]GGC15414.1 hypothetical protein GCM10010972_30860 [Cellulomonas carbonis]